MGFSTEDNLLKKHFCSLEINCLKYGNEEQDNRRTVLD